MAFRESLPTLTEDEFHTACDRVTIPSPIPAEMVRWMMAEAEDGTPDPRASGVDARTSSAPDSDVREVPASRVPASAPRALPTLQAASKPHADVQEELEITEMPLSEQAGVVDDLIEGYLERLGDRAGVPFASLPPEHARAFPLDHWAGFILSLVDGNTSIEDIVDAAPMPEHDTLRLLSDLRRQGIIDIRPR